MSDPLTAEAPPDAAPYASLEELKAEHSTLLRRRRGGFEDNPAAFLGEVETFLKRGFATGRILGDEAERYSAQSLLTYWSNALYREGREVPEDALAEFDPGQTPELADTECPYVGLGQQQEGDRPLMSSGWNRLLDESLKVIERDRFLAIVGANGSGRHPLIYGGILPALRNGALQGSENWRILPPLVPGADPLAELLRHLHPEAEHRLDRAPARGPAGESRESGRLARGWRRAAGRGGDRAVRRAVRAERPEPDPAVRRGLAGAGPGSRCASRHHPGNPPRQPEPDLGDGRLREGVQRNQVLMSFTNRELRQMVEEPAKRVGLKYDDGVVDRLLLDVQGDPAVLDAAPVQPAPALEEPAGQSDHPRDLRRDRRRPPGGGPPGGTGLCLPQPRATGGRQARVPEAGPRGGRVAGDLSARAAEPAHVPGRLAGCDRIRAGPPDRWPDPGVEGGRRPGEAGLRLVHEAAATAWPRAVEWLDEFRARHRWQLGLRTAAEQWRDKGRNTGALGGEAPSSRLETSVAVPGGRRGTQPPRRGLPGASRAAETRWIWAKRGLMALTIVLSLCIAWLYSANAAARREAAEAKEAKAKAEAKFAIDLVDQEKRSRQRRRIAAGPLVHRRSDPPRRVRG